MVITWNGETLDCKTLRTKPGYLKCGDFILYAGQLCKVITIQRDAVSFDTLRSFCMFTLETRDGTIVPARSLPQLVTIERKKRKVV